jgi:hypothetical protein
MEQKAQTSKAVDWREAWRPAFERILASIAVADKLTRG